MYVLLSLSRGTTEYDIVDLLRGNPLYVCISLEDDVESIVDTT